MVVELREAVVEEEAMAEATVHRLRTWEVEAVVGATARHLSHLVEDTAAATVVAAAADGVTTHTD